MKSIEKEERPWGRFFVIHDENKYKLKRIEVEPGGKLSYQYHKKRSEVWTIVEGEAFVTLEGKTSFYKPGETVIIAKELKHRVENKGDKKLIFIEVQTGTYFGEDDIIRLEDDYNRI
jgi:mannose-6-phosphate isomerase